MGRWVMLVGFMLCAACSGSQAPEDAGMDAGTDDAGAPDGGAWDAGRDAGLGPSDAGLCSDRTFIRACTPLYPCGGQVRRPAEGKCDAGYFPVRDYACGPPLRLDDGGWECGCRTYPLDLPGVGPVDDERCLPQCEPDLTCAVGTCARVGAFWGSDVGAGAYVPLCL